MGASTSWLAVKGKTPAKILGALSLRIGDSPGDAQETGLQGCAFPGGWYVIMAGGYEHPLTEDKTLKMLSAGCEVIAGGVEEHVMCSIARGWKDGREVWSVARDPDADHENLITQGQLPAVFAGIQEELRAKQEAEGGPDCGVDFIFSAPDVLTKALTGFHFDEFGSDEEWQALVPEGPRKS